MSDRLRNSQILAHQEWLGFVQPVGLVVAPAVLVQAQIVPDRNVAGRQRALRDILEVDEAAPLETYRAFDLRSMFLDYLEWQEGDLVDARRHAETLDKALPELQTRLAATWAVPAEDDPETDWTMLVRVEEDGCDLDAPPRDPGGWNASRHARFERLLRENEIPTGLLCTNERIRLVHAPRGETSGHITFEFSQMATPAGRPILAAFDMLLSADTLFSGPLGSRLPALLHKSREAQSEVSTQLSRQVLAALHTLLRGFVKADTRGFGASAVLARHPAQHFYGGLITTLMRLVFVLYAEDRGLMPNHPVYQQHYSLGGLFVRLRADAAAWPDTMDQRFGAWAQILSLFRLIHGGGGHARLSFVARRGTLFDPDEFPFLEGGVDSPPDHEDTRLPLVPDSTVWEVLQLLMVLDGERLSYRTLDVQQIGSVYEAIMGFRIERTTGSSIAVTSPHASGAAVVVDLDRLLAVDDTKRAKALLDATDRKLPAQAGRSLKEATTLTDVVAALDRVIDHDVTPDIVPSETPVLQPTDERRRTGSHYTPRSLTEPIVAEALRPMFMRLGPDASPDAILDLKVLDPATGSAAFLVETCRQLSARLVEAWARHGAPAGLDSADDQLLHARRLVAQRCLYGVDRNPMANDLGRLSLWLATLAKDQEFTFVDHTLRHGDSLVGLSQRQIESFHWDDSSRNLQYGFEIDEIQNRVRRIAEHRNLIRELGDQSSDSELRDILREINDDVSAVRRSADLVLAAFFEGSSSRNRDSRRETYAEMHRSEVHDDAVALNQILTDLPLAPFHWELEFPEVFDRANPGFDVIVGNPPFGGKNTIIAGNPPGYLDWLKHRHPGSHGNADLAAHFFRHAFGLLREGGTLGLIATNTIAQGDTRASGLRGICTNGGTIYRASRRLKWPGKAAVVVSVIHIAKGDYSGPCFLDDNEVDGISAFLAPGDRHDDPERLRANAGKSFQGSIVLGMGFTFDDTDTRGIASSLADMRRLIEADPKNKEGIFP